MGNTSLRERRNNRYQIYRGVTRENGYRLQTIFPLSFTIALCRPAAGWLVVRYYLQQFAHRVGFMPSVFLLALVIVGALCSAVVLYHYLKTARMNPATTLKNE